MTTLEILQNSFADFGNSIIESVPNILAASVILIVFLVARSLVHHVATETLTVQTRKRVLYARIAEFTLISAGIVITLTTLGVDITGLLTGLGLITVGLSFALRDAIMDFIAGIELLGRAPFELGQLIDLAGTRGRVMEIGTRTTVIDTENGSRVTVPNRDLLGKVLGISTVQDNKRVTWDITLDAKNDLSKFAEAAAEVIANIKGTKKQTADLQVIEIKPGAITARIVCLVSSGADVTAIYEEGMRRLAKVAHVQAG